MTTRYFLHHVGAWVTDFAASERFFTAALAPLGIEPGWRTDSAAEYWTTGADTPSFAMDVAPTPDDVTRGVHLAFGAENRAQVDAFYAAAVGAGGTPRHEPRHWAEYGAYCAFVSDPDGNNIEALVKPDHEKPES